MKPDVEGELMRFLQAQKIADVAGTLKTIADWTLVHEKDDALRHAEIRGELRGYSLRIGALEKNDEKIDKELEKSGSWQLEAEQAKHIMAANSATWWKEKAITVIVGLVMLLLGGVVTILFKR